MMYHLSSSDDDVEELVELVEVPKNRNFFEDTVPQFNDQQYLEHFRISSEVMDQLSDRYEASEYYHHQEGDSQKISPLKSLTVFLWFASNEAASFRVVADRFGITKSSLHKIVRRVTYFLSNLSVEVIKWPTNEEKVDIQRFFMEQNFPGVIGVIDGTHIRIDKPTEDPDSYLNRKQFHSIQVTCIYK